LRGDYPSSYRNIFNRAGIQLPRSARIRVDYDQVNQNPEFNKQLKEIIDYKEKKGRELLEQSR
jgi:hypothetical protein